MAQQLLLTDDTNFVFFSALFLILSEEPTWDRQKAKIIMQSIRLIITIIRVATQ